MIEGISHTSYYIIAPEDTATSQGSGQLEVLATPRLVALMENAAMLTVAPSLNPGETTVGGMISITHLAPSAVGAALAATAVLDKIEGRKLSFTVSAKEGDRLIGEGTHVRFIVDKERFMAKLHEQMNNNHDILITRIKEMEDRYHRVMRVLGKLNTAIEEYNDFKGELAILKDYMESGQWLKDYEADEAGQVSADIKREVLSQDALYNLLEDVDKFIAFAKSSL